MTSIKETLVGFLSLDIFSVVTCVFILIISETFARTGMRDAFQFKKSKSRVKKENEQRSLLYKVFGLYCLSNTKAPYHMKKYAIIRITNLVFFIVEIILHFCLAYLSGLRLVFSVLILLHFFISVVPFVFETIILSNTKEYGKLPDFDKSKKP